MVVEVAAARRVMLRKSCWINLHFHHCLSSSLPDSFQMSGKRSRSFKCAVHQRDREITSENDFHILLQQPPFFKRWVLLSFLVDAIKTPLTHPLPLQNGSRNRDGSASGGARQEVLRRQLFVLSAPAVCDIRYPGRGEYHIIIGSWFWNYLLVHSFVLGCFSAMRSLHRIDRLDHGHVRGPSRIYYEAASSVGWCILMKGQRDPRQIGNFVQLKRRLWWAEVTHFIVSDRCGLGFVIKWGQHVLWWFIPWRSGLLCNKGDWDQIVRNQMNCIEDWMIYWLKLQYRL